MIDRRSMLSAIVATALLPPSITMTSPAAAQGTNRVERLWTGFSSPVGMAFDKSGNGIVTLTAHRSKCGIWWDDQIYP
jgi:hypothetical protein